ncbi:MAG TPA: lipid-A-disaccharide synthase [Terriglobales bacterium]|nr:lipid-A-disaccharide synthase [Terriglobales bacterium]
MQVLISAGEASGEMYGAKLIEALRRRAADPANLGTRLGSVPAGQSPATTQDSQLDFFGAGGERMRAAGCEIVVDARDLAVVGITEILSHLPKILGLYRKLIRAADVKRPDLAIVIDSPAFNWRVARQMRKRGIPVVYYVCPQFWAWRQGRVKLLRKYVDKALVIFPFEEKFYRDRGVDATFAGHPLAGLPAPEISREAYAAEHQLDASKRWITLMPGSRRKEVRMNLPTILEAADRLQADCLEKDRSGSGYEFLLPVARTLDSSFLAELIAAPTETRQAASLRRNIHLVPEALPALFHSRAGIVASGTATVEAALMGTPFVMVYRVSALTYALGKPRVKVPHFAMVNLIAEGEVVPELVQHKFTAVNIVTELNKIIPDGEPRTRMMQRLAAVKARLQGNGSRTHPSETAAEIILKMIGQGRA